MSYTLKMREQIERVEATRQERLQGYFPRMTAPQKEDVLKNFHPDYIEASMRSLAVGVNKGGRVPHELADLLEARSRMEGVHLDLEQVNYDVDVLVHWRRRRRGRCGAPSAGTGCRGATGY